jgi:hypothetical protein
MIFTEQSFSIKPMRLNKREQNLVDLFNAPLSDLIQSEHSKAIPMFQWKNKKAHLMKKQGRSNYLSGRIRGAVVEARDKERKQAVDYGDFFDRFDLRVTTNQDDELFLITKRCGGTEKKYYRVFGYKKYLVNEPYEN